jgi:hypothetical protein
MKNVLRVGLAIAILVACGSEGPSVFQDPNGGGGDAGSSGTSGGLGGPTTDSGPPAEVATDVEAVVTTDNAFSFGYGSDSKLASFIQGEGSDGPGIFNCPVGFGPRAFLVPAAQAPAGAYLYIIAWADEEVTQGTIAQFKRVGGQAIYTGDGKWEGCAVGKPYEDLGLGPDQATVDLDIGECNKGAAGATYSKGWVTTGGALTPGALGKLAFGETNEDAGGDFPIVCQKDDAGVSGIDPLARWMWFDPQDGSSAFVGNAGNRTKTFLIFRLPASALPPPVK